MPTEDRIAPGLVEELLALPTRGQQAGLLRSRELLDADGLDRLLDTAEHLTRDDPGKAHKLAELCADLAEIASAPAAVPRAAYIRVRTHNENGEFGAALRMIEIAHDGYLDLGMEFAALRTNAGLMVTLLELGRYQEALEAGRVVLEALYGKGGLVVGPAPAERELLAASVHLNRGGCYEYMGRYDEALAAYATAETCYRTLGMTERIGEILDNRGAIFSSLGRGSEALAAHEAAADIFEEAGLAFLHNKALINVGEAHLRLGNYRLSLDAFERARRHLDSLEARADGYLFLRHTADAYLELNLYSEALATYREAEHFLREAGMVHDHAQALWGMGSALIRRSELGEAEKMLAEAGSLFTAADNTPLVSGVMLEQASLQATRGDRAGALTTAQRALDLVSGESWPVQAVYARLRLADLLLPDVAKVEPHLLEARRLTDSLALSQLRYRLDERLGHLRRLQGNEKEALSFLEAAIDEIERLRGTVARDAVRTSFLRDKTAAYEDLMQLHLEREDEESTRRAFAVAERAKSRALVDLLTGVTEKKEETAGDPERERRLRTLQADLNSVYNELLDGGQELEVPFLDLQARAAELEDEISRLRLHDTAMGPASDPFAEDAALDAVLDAISPDVTLLAYHAVGDEILAFVHARGRLRVARRLGKVGEIERLLQKLALQWDRLRVDRRFVVRHMTTLERSARQVLSGLYERLVAPLEPLLPKTTEAAPGGPSFGKLAVVPHGSLHQVPFHALFDGERYLIERFEISYAPSAAVYAICQERSTGGLDEALVMGVEDPLIPAATAEARAVADRLPAARARVGEEATVTALRRDAPGHGILHLACHGLFRSDNPMFSALKLHDGWLMAADAMSLDLPDALVVLSACESGRTGVVGGDEILGLTRAFLGAGAATLVVSLWLVQDETTADLMGSWYERLNGGMTRAAALRNAQLELMKRHPHPYYWAPFVLTGRR